MSIGDRQINGLVAIPKSKNDRHTIAGLHWVRTTLMLEETIFSAH